MPGNAELDLDPPEAEMHPPPHGGLSPLMLGVLLGMMVLGAVIMWIVLQARINDLETRFTQLDERLQVLVADTRRQGDALRQLVGKPGVLPPAIARSEPAEGQGDELERALDAQQERIASLEKLLAGVKQELAESEASGTQAGRGPAPAPAAAPPPAPTTPAPAPAPVRQAPAKPAAAPVAIASPKPKAVEPQEPPAGFSVILASLPERDLALQELERLRVAGVAAVLREARVGNGTWYRIQVEGFITRDAATGFARDVENRHGISGAWVLAP